MYIKTNPEEYAKEMNMTIEQAEVRCNYFEKLEKKLIESKKCPVCGEYTLEEGFEENEDYIYCDNDEVEKEKENGEKFFTSCDFIDENTGKYLFVFEINYDVVAVAAETIKDIKDSEEVTRFLGGTWEEFVERQNKILLENK